MSSSSPQDVSLQATISQLQQDLQCAHSDYDKAVTEREEVATAMQELEGDLVRQRDLLQGQLAQQQAALEELGRAQKRLQGEYAQCCDEVRASVGPPTGGLIRSYVHTLRVMAVCLSVCLSVCAGVLQAAFCPSPRDRAAREGGRVG